MKILKVYYLKRYRRAHAKMREMNRSGEKPTARSSAQYTKWQNQAKKYGLKWWASEPRHGFGGDLTLLPITLDDVKEQIAKYPAGPQPHKYVGEDKSSKVEFKRHADGNIYMYRDGVKEELPVRGLGVKD